ncbi:MAG: discoidin domain-containing protein [Candidatus Omnitrophica bacterium]|nr:discoidin domain-containing protein [Candidatus Omnitrophota bacterium]
MGKEIKKHRKEEMKRIFVLALSVAFIGMFAASGCARQEGEVPPVPEEKVSGAVQSAAVEEKIVPVEVTGEAVFIEITAAEASSFDITPDWAPEPNPMAVADGDLLTRWSSDYAEGDQWIQLDLGKERTVNEVVITWERAYATAYKIFVSQDAREWKEVYGKDDCRGGRDEITFDPVKGRYVRILGTARVNEDWGISIWEVEVFGPSSGNEGANVTKTEYMAKTQDQAKAQEAADKLEAMASDVPSLEVKPFQKGLVYTSWMSDEMATPASDLTLVRLKEIGFDTVAIMVPAYQDTTNSEVIFTNDRAGGDTPTDEVLRHVIASCHKIGLRVLLKPHIDPRTNEARINIMASEKWFDSFEEFTLRYARLAEETGCEIFAVGTELEATTFSAWAARWNQVIDKVREVYKGKLTYAANWTEYEEVPFWDKMDMIGIDAYFPLAETNDPTYEDLVNAWEQIADKIQGWLEVNGLTDKGLILTEIGYPSSDGAARQPWVAITSTEDQQEQADCLNATFEVLTKRPWFKGYYIWQYFPQERWSPLGFTVNGKKAEQTIIDWLKK